VDGLSIVHAYSMGIDIPKRSKLSLIPSEVIRFKYYDYYISTVIISNLKSNFKCYATKHLNVLLNMQASGKQK
jgi:hypothetical protein